MSKSLRSNLNFRQTAREFRSAASSKIYGHIQRFFPYSRYHVRKIWTLASKPVKIASKFLKKS